MNNSIENYDVETFNLTKHYPLKGKGNFITALDNINLKVKSGEILGLLGPNGAGKTTMVSILATLIQPSSGYATILGHDILKDSWFVRENVGVMFGGDMIYLRLTGYRNLKFFCKLYGIKDYKQRIKEIMEKLNLFEWTNQYVSSYSTGMKIKLALARVLLINPKILFLDEPMLGMDPKSVNEIIDIIKELKKTIFFTSHQMNIVAKLCDRIAFLKKGKIINVDTQENFKKMISKKIKIQINVSTNEQGLINSISKLSFINDIENINGNISFFIDKETDFQDLFNFLKDYPITSINKIEPNLEDVFIKLSG